MQGVSIASTIRRNAIVTCSRIIPRPRALTNGKLTKRRGKDCRMWFRLSPARLTCSFAILVFVLRATYEYAHYTNTYSHCLLRTSFAFGVDRVCLVFTIRPAYYMKCACFGPFNSCTVMFPSHRSIILQGKDPQVVVPRCDWSTSIARKSESNLGRRSVVSHPVQN